jgi:hypothetical protein
MKFVLKSNTDILVCGFKFQVRFHFELVNTQNMKLIEYPIFNTECPISKEITTANAVQGVRRQSLRSSGDSARPA